MPLEPVRLIFEQLRLAHLAPVLNRVEVHGLKRFGMTAIFHNFMRFVSRQVGSISPTHYWIWVDNHRKAEQPKANRKIATTVWRLTALIIEHISDYNQCRL